MTDLASDSAGAAAFAARPPTGPLAVVAEAAAFVAHPTTRALLVVSDAAAAIMLAVDLLVVSGCVVARVLFNAPVEWADDVARGLMVGSSFFGAASAMARHESLGITYFVARLRPALREVVDAVGALLVLAMSALAAAAKAVRPATAKKAGQPLIYFLVQSGAIWCNLVQFGAIPRRELQSGCGRIAPAFVKIAPDGIAPSAWDGDGASL